MRNAVIADRKANPTDKNDLLNRMLSGKDPKSGKGLSDDNIKNNVGINQCCSGCQIQWSNIQSFDSCSRSSLLVRSIFVLDGTFTHDRLCKGHETTSGTAPLCTKRCHC